MDMSNALALLLFVGIVILLVVLTVGSYVLRARRFAEASARLERQSLERGWQYNSYRESGTTAHNFSGKTDGVTWHIESYYRRSSSSRRGGSSSSVRYTRWWTEAAALSDEVVLLIPSMGNAFQALGPGGIMPGGPMSGGLAGLASSLIQMFLRYFVTNVLHAAPEDAWVFEDARQVQAGSEALRQRFTVIANSEMTADRFLDDDAERMLLELVPEKWSSTQTLRVMAVVYWHRGIQFIAEGQIVEIEKLEQIVQLGLALVSGQKSSAWS